MGELEVLSSPVAVTVLVTVTVLVSVTVLVTVSLLGSMLCEKLGLKMSMVERESEVVMKDKYQLRLCYGRVLSREEPPGSVKKHLDNGKLYMSHNIASQ